MTPAARTRTWITVLGRSAMLLLIATATACGSRAPAPAPTVQNVAPAPDVAPAAASTAIADEAKQMWASLCSVCHGMDGKGTGPAAAQLEPKPRDYTSAAWQASVSDDEIRQIILLGGQGVGRSALMPAQPQLRDRPELLDALVQLIRGFAKG